MILGALTRTCRQALTWTAFAALLLSAGQISAAEPYRAFLRALQDQGYGEAGILYVEQLRARADTPDEIRQILDLEQARSMRVAASETENADEATQRLMDASKYLDKFIKEHADNPEAPAAYFTYGEIVMTRAEKGLEAGQVYSDPVERETRLVGPRALLEEARKYFAAAAAGYDKQLAALPEPPPAAEEPAPKTSARGAPPKVDEEKKRRTDLEESWAESRFKLASAGLLLGRSYPATMKTERTAAFKRAEAEFDSVYQRFRFYRLGIFSHLWQAKVAIEMDDVPLAIDILEEVLANAPEPGTRIDMAIEPILSEAELSRLRILSGRGKHEEVVDEAREWLKSYVNYYATVGAQGIALEMSRSELALAEKLDKDQRARAMRGALVRLAELARHKGTHQRDAILLRRQYASEGGDNTFDSFAEAMAVAEAALSDSNWTNAISAYEKAIELGKGKQSVAELNAVRLSLARALGAAGKHDEAISAAEKLAREQPEPEAAPQAGALAVNLALSAFVAASDKTKARQRLFTLADFMTQRWPNRSETDDARLALGKLELAENHLDQAAKVFEAMNPASQRYPLALHFAAQAHWMAYLAEQRKTPEARNEKLAADNRAQAVEQLNKSLALQRDANRNVSTPPPAMIETMVLSAEMHLEKNEFSEAMQLLVPAMAAIGQERGKPLDHIELRVAVAATKAALGLQQPQETIAAASVIAERGEDTPVIDTFLVAVLQQVRLMLKDAEAPESMGAMAASLAARKQVQSTARLVVAEECARAHRNDLARAQYELLIEMADKDEAWKQKNSRLVAHARSRIIELLRDDGQFAQALDQAERLMRDNPQKLDPLMAKARVLDRWAQTEPEKLDTAIEQWTEVRTKLQRMQETVPEYYEAVYGAALCLLERSKRQKDEESKKAAEQLLRSTLVLHPKLDSPENVARYNQLLERLHAKR